VVADRTGTPIGGGVPIGRPHLYERHTGLARRVLGESPPAVVEMPVMEPISELSTFFTAEREIRRGGKPPVLTPYWAELAGAIIDFSNSRTKESGSSLMELQHRPPSGAARAALNPPSYTLVVFIPGRTKLPR
jgi:hypothetical protein